MQIRSLDEDHFSNIGDRSNRRLALLRQALLWHRNSLAEHVLEFIIPKQTRHVDQAHEMQALNAPMVITCRVAHVVLTDRRFNNGDQSGGGDGPVQSDVTDAGFIDVDADGHDDVGELIKLLDGLSAFFVLSRVEEVPVHVNEVSEQVPPITDWTYLVNRIASGKYNPRLSSGIVASYSSRKNDSYRIGSVSSWTAREMAFRLAVVPNACWPMRCSAMTA
jgi:hypothetical protein